MKNNFFDNIELNLTQLKEDVYRYALLPSRYTLPKINMLLHLTIHSLPISKEFIYSYIFVGWFKDFNLFWSKILHGRPIDITTFHFLRSHYRIKFQQIAHMNESNSDSFIKAWNTNATIYLLFEASWKYSRLAYLEFLLFLRYLPKTGNVLEYGCGIAPFTTGMLKYFPSRKYFYEIADIQQITFMYAIYKLSKNKKVSPRILGSHSNLATENNYSIIVCQTVLEHIPNPLEVVKSFYKALDTNGVLVFDYIKGDGDGLDSKNSVKERASTLEYIQKNFHLVKGVINVDTSVGLCIVKKK